MNLVKYYIAEEGILSKLKDRFSNKKKDNERSKEDERRKKESEINIKRERILNSMPNEILNAEINLRKKEVNICINIVKSLFANKKKYFRDYEKLEFAVGNINDYDDELYDYFFELTVEDVRAERFFSKCEKDVGSIMMKTGAPILGFDDYFMDEEAKACGDLNRMLKTKNLKCITGFLFDGDKRYLGFTIEIKPSEDFLRKVNEYKNAPAEESIFNRIKNFYNPKNNGDFYRYSNGLLDAAYKQANLSMNIPSNLGIDDFIDIRSACEDDAEYEKWDYFTKDVRNVVKKFINTKAYTDEVNRMCEYHNSHKQGDENFDVTLPRKININWWKSQFNSSEDDPPCEITICENDRFANSYGIPVLKYICKYINKKYDCDAECENGRIVFN